MPRGAPAEGRSASAAIAFQGRLSRNNRLKPGAYALTIGAVNAAGQWSAPAALAFTIAR